MWKILALALLAVAHAAYYEDFAAKQVPEHNAQKSTWTAGYNKRLAGLSKEKMARLAGTKLDKVNGPIIYPKKKGTALPDSFDARQQWSQCPLIGFIRDQADCGSCWAVSSSAAMGDRTCIQSNGADQLYLSDEDVMSCCNFCGSGCDGGYPLMAWRYWQTEGVVTGGPYDSHQGCLPYEIPPESLAKPKANSGDGDTPACPNPLACEKGYATSWNDDKHYGSSFYSVGNGVDGMQQELFENGPIVSAFSVYEDFYNYVSGVYKYDGKSRYVGGHAVKVIGWGIEDDADKTAYWLVANSWNASWGMQGLFKIVRGINDCGFESSISAGQAKTN